MIHSSNYSLQHQVLLSWLQYIGTQWWEKKWQFKQWILYRLDSEALPLVEAGYNRRKTSLDGEKNPMSLRQYLLRGSFGILYTPFQAAQSGPEATSIYGWNYPHVIFPVPRVFGVWVADGSLQWWGRRRGTSQGSKPFFEPPTNYWWTLHHYPAHKLIEQIATTHTCWLLSAVLRGWKLSLLVLAQKDILSISLL